MKSRLLLFFIVVFAFVFAGNNVAKAQNSLKVVIVDSTSHTPVEFATFSIKYIGEQVAKRYAVSDSTGLALIKSAPVGRASVRIECIGYDVYEGIFDVHRGVNDMGRIAIKANTVLNTIVVSAAGNQMVVKKDTIEYNANSFKTNDTDMLEDLVKKLPGLEIDSDGKITSQGKEITKVLIDGKTFFMDDPQLATKNLPAKIIDKIKVVEKKSDEAKFTGIDDGDEETVLDLSIKKGMADGWIGNVGGGYGTKERYEGSFMVGRFTKNDQISFIGNANNTNNRGFNDMAGSMMSTMMSGGGMGGGMAGMGGFSFTGSGVTASKMAGLNYNHQSDDQKFKANVSYLYSATDKDVVETKDRTTMFSESSSQHSSEAGGQNTVSHGHRIDAEIEYAPSDMTSFIFRPYVRLGNGNFDQNNSFTTIRDLNLTNQGTSKSFGDNDSQRIGGSLLYRQRLWKPGRTMTLRLNYSFSNNVIDGYNVSETNFYGTSDDDDENEDNPSSTTSINQYYHNGQRSAQYGINFTYTEPLGKNYFIQGSYRYSHQHSNTLKNTFDYDPVTDTYTIKNEEYSSRYIGEYATQRAEIALRKQEDRYNFMFGVSMQPSKTTSSGRERDTSYTVTNFAPTARLDYRISDTKFLRLYYRGRTSQPSLNQLLPIPDNSNPLLVQEGNANLNPSFTHSMGGEFRSSNREKFSFFSTFFNASYTTDNIINEKRYSEDGVQHNRYVNSDKGVYNVNLRAVYNARFKNQDFSYFVMFYTGLSNGVSYVASNGDFVENVTKNFNLNFNGRLMYRIDNLECSIGAGTNFRNAWYSVKSLDKVSTWTTRLSTSVNWTFLKTFNVTTDLSHRFYSGYSAGYGEAQTIWDGEISKSFLGNAFTLKARVYDILNKSRNTYRTTSENYVLDVTNNTLGRYVLFTLTYRFGSFGGQSARSTTRRGFMGPPSGGGRMRH